MKQMQEKIDGTNGRTLNDIFKMNTIEDPYGAQAIFAPSEVYPRLSLSELEEKIKLGVPKFTAQSRLLREVDPSEINGWCHGLSLKWLKKTAKGEQQQFFETYDSILTGNQHSISDELNKKILKFSNSIRKGQSPEEYYADLGQQDINLLWIVQTTTQFDKLGNGYTLHKWKNILQEMVAEGYDMFSITSFTGTDRNHTVAIYIDAGEAYFYDSNDRKREDRNKRPFTPYLAAHWLEKALYTNCGLKTERYMLMNLRITGVKSSDFLQRKQVVQDQSTAANEKTTENNISNAASPSLGKRKRVEYEHQSFFKIEKDKLPNNNKKIALEAQCMP